MSDRNNIDPRFRNELPNAPTVADYLKKYSAVVHKTLEELPSSPLRLAFESIEAAVKKNAQIFVAGNGGSAAIADHLVCDWTKGTHVDHKPPMKVQSLVANGALFTALANDFGYEQSISKQIEMFGSEGDLLILISSSGNSPNIISALKVAKSKKLTVIGLSGFSGGTLLREADTCIHIPLNNYGMVEDAHQMVMHCIAQHLATLRDK